MLNGSAYKLRSLSRCPYCSKSVSLLRNVEGAEIDGHLRGICQSCGTHLQQHRSVRFIPASVVNSHPEEKPLH